MPLVAIVGAAIAGAIAAPAIGALIGAASFGAGLASIGVVGALEIVGALGATLGAVGAVTRDKGLQTAGLIIGGIGAVGSIAASAGLFGDSAAIFGSAAETGASAAGNDVASDIAFAQSGNAAIAADESVQAYNTGVQLGTGTNDIINSTLNLSPAGNAVEVSPLSDVTKAATGNAASITQDPASAIVKGVTTEPTPAAIANVTPPKIDISGVDPLAGFKGPTTTLDSGTAISGAPQKSMFSGLMDFTKNNPMATYGLVQAAGSFISGATNPITPAQVASLDAQAAANRANAAVTNQVAANMSGGMPIAKLRPVNSAPVTGMPAGTGMINSSPVTGSPTP